MVKFLDRPMAVAFEKNFPEVILGVATTAFGLMLSIPPDSMQYAQGYSTMAGLAPSWVWGVAFVLLGLVNMHAILRRKGDRVRGTAKVLSLLWFFTAFLFLFSAWASPGWILLLCVAVLYGGVSSEYRTKSKYHDGTGELGPDL